jgi:hypothetical protein
MAWAAKEANAKSAMALVALPRGGGGKTAEFSGKVDSRWLAGFLARESEKSLSGLKTK